MDGRLARDDEVRAWYDDGYVLLDGLVGTATVDTAREDLWRVFPRPDKFHADPARHIPAGKRNEELRRGWPELLGFPPPGHPIWSSEYVEATAARYPNLDLAPWRAALSDA